MTLEGSRAAGGPWTAAIERSRAAAWPRRRPPAAAAGEPRGGRRVRTGPGQHRGRDRAVPSRLLAELAERSLGGAAGLGERERHSGQVPCPDHVVAAFGLAGTDHGVAQHHGVDRIRGEPQPVAMVGAADHLRAGLRPRAGDHDLQRLGRVGRDVLGSPDLVDQPSSPPATGVDERGQQGVGAPAGQRGAVPGHLVEQPQVGSCGQSGHLVVGEAERPRGHVLGQVAAPVPGMARTCGPGAGSRPAGPAPRSPRPRGDVEDGRGSPSAPPAAPRPRR